MRVRPSLGNLFLAACVAMSARAGAQPVRTCFVVGAVVMATGGSGYTNAQIGGIVLLTGGGGSGATAEIASIYQGHVTSVAVILSGSGYTSAPTVIFPPPASGGTNATAISTLANCTVPGTAEIKEFGLSDGSFPNFIVAGPDGNMYFTEAFNDAVGMITPSGAISEAATPSGCVPIGITVGADGIVWAACSELATIGFASNDGGLSFTYNSVAAQPAAGPLTVGPDGLIWYKAADANGTVVAFDDHSGNTFATHVAVTNGISLSGGPDARIWAASGKYILSLNAAGGGPGNFATSDVYLITRCAGQPGAWFTELGGDRIGLASLNSGGGLDVFELPTGSGSTPTGIACAMDGSVWFTDQGTNKIVRRRTDGVFEEFTVPTAGALPYGIAVGFDNTVWFTENVGQKIGRLRIHPIGDVNGDGKVDVADLFYVINFLFAGGPAPI